MSDERQPYAGLMGERLAPPPADAPTRRQRPPLEPLRPPRDLDVRYPSTPSESGASTGAMIMIVLTFVLLVILAGRAGAPPAPMPVEPTTTATITATTTGAPAPTAQIAQCVPLPQGGADCTGQVTP